MSGGCSAQDVDQKIRSEWLQTVPAVLAEHPDAAADLNGAIPKPMCNGGPDESRS